MQCHNHSSIQYPNSFNSIFYKDITILASNAAAQRSADTKHATCKGVMPAEFRAFTTVANLFLALAAAVPSYCAAAAA